jgi:hypothetical protein
LRTHLGALLTFWNFDLDEVTGDLANGTISRYRKQNVLAAAFFLVDAIKGDEI